MDKNEKSFVKYTLSLVTSWDGFQLILRQCLMLKNTQVRNENGDK